MPNIPVHGQPPPRPARGPVTSSTPLVDSTCASRKRLFAEPVFAEVLDVCDWCPRNRESVDSLRHKFGALPVEHRDPQYGVPDNNAIDRFVYACYLFRIGRYMGLLGQALDLRIYQLSVVAAAAFERSLRESSIDYVGAMRKP